MSEKCALVIYVFIFLIVFGFQYATVDHVGYFSTGKHFVTVKQGTLVGSTMTSSDGRVFSAYLGIPFAQPPVGKLRFQPPVPASPWNGILNAIKKADGCVQCKEYTKDIVGEEDCLTLNIYTPLNAKPGDNIPVIVYIFGGIFKEGTSNKFGPQYFMNKDIILVMANYRLGPLGFLSTGDNVVSGNMGLKDQTLALKWTNENIFAFGGDVTRITLYGHSAGAMSTHLHTLSSLSEGLFNRVIMQSGTGFSTASFFNQEVSKTIARELAKRVGCNSSFSSTEILSCLMTVDGGTLVVTQKDMNVWQWNPDMVFRPTVEEATAKDAFLTEIPIKTSYRSTDQEWLIGMTTGEQIRFTGSYLLDDVILEQVNTDYEDIFPLSLQYLWHARLRDLNFISTFLKDRYFGNETIDSEMADNITLMYSQGIIGSNINEALRRYTGTKYVYLYDYVSGYTVHNQMDKYGKVYGVCHADEVPQMFYESDKSIYLRPEDIIFGQEMITRWINFAYSGNPNTPHPINESLFSSWDPATTERIEYLHLKVNGTMKTDYYTSEYKFWKSLPIFSKYF